MFLKTILILALLLVTIAVAVHFVGQASWRSSLQSLQAELASGKVAPQVKTYSIQELEGLPEPVQRYFQTVLNDGQALIRHARIKHRGSFNMGETDDNWQPFTSDQLVVTHPRGFIWDASIRMAPGMTVSVVDAYVAGRGVLEAKLFGLMTVMKQPASPQLDQGELLRFLAEAAWYPTALLPSQGVEWQAVDANRAVAVLTDSGTRVSLTVTFDEAGLIESVRSEERYRDVDGAQIPTPWEGRFWEYEEKDGLNVPMAGEVAWMLPEGPKPYWRGRMTDIQYEYVRK